MNIYLSGIPSRIDEMLDLNNLLRKFIPPQDGMVRHQVSIRVDRDRSPTDEDLKEAKRRMAPLDICIFFPLPTLELATLDLASAVDAARIYGRPLIYIVDDDPHDPPTPHADRNDVLRYKSGVQSVAQEIERIARNYSWIPRIQEYESYDAWKNDHPWRTLDMIRFKMQ